MTASAGAFGDAQCDDEEYAASGLRERIRRQTAVWLEALASIEHVQNRVRAAAVERDVDFVGLAGVPDDIADEFAKNEFRARAFIERIPPKMYG